ncbi:hypothetical protein M440DRAFT_1395580 [Trichoderma longibrachiatum ATCC 18648]|uniref:Uncharacterized protein n=1 Tax=Trichoderma longibrachiatum ATCC 18648 TaxID=983965 RepID=A0A2T4BQR7_TRILO|nr:hypothetical protein M440DRAFT_1395580 [Trichoderma longibrachiatum ATCC 18648]
MCRNLQHLPAACISSRIKSSQIKVALKRRIKWLELLGILGLRSRVGRPSPETQWQALSKRRGIEASTCLDFSKTAFAAFSCADKAMGLMVDELRITSTSTSTSTSTQQLGARGNGYTIPQSPQHHTILETLFILPRPQIDSSPAISSHLHLPLASMLHVLFTSPR